MNFLQQSRIDRGPKDGVVARIDGYVSQFSEQWQKPSEQVIGIPSHNLEIAENARLETRNLGQHLTSSCVISTPLWDINGLTWFSRLGLYLPKTRFAIFDVRYEVRPKVHKALKHIADQTL